MAVDLQRAIKISKDIMDAKDMAVDLKRAIEVSKDIMSDKIHPVNGRFGQFDRCYFSTTEDIKAYLKGVHFNKEKALCVLASGDHVFNLISLGVKKIDTFDINELTYFTFYLRRALLLGFPRIRDFENVQIDFFGSKSIRRVASILASLKEFMPDDVYCYYEELVKYNNHVSRGNYSLFQSLYRGYCNSVNADYNVYMESEEQFKRLLDRIETAKVNFRFGDIRDIKDSLGNNYDLMLLSNIADYNFDFSKPEGIKSFKKFLASLGANLALDGVIINYFIICYPSLLAELDMPFSGFGCDFEEKLVDDLDSSEVYYWVRKRVK